MRRRWLNIWICLACVAGMMRIARAADDTARFDGQWRGSVPVNGQTFTIISLHDGASYKNYAISPAGSQFVGGGTFSAVDGKWKVTAAMGNDSGTYQFTDDNTAVCKNAAGVTVVWTRDKTQVPGIPWPKGPGPNDVTPEIKADIQAKMKAGDFEGAWGDLAKIQSWKSSDAMTITLDATVRFGMGQVDVARNESALVMQMAGHLDDAEALRVHAQAAAAMGDLREADEDLKRFAKLRGNDSPVLEKLIQEIAAREPVGCAADQIVPQRDQLLRIAAEGAVADALIRNATILIKGENNVRKVEFDIYRRRKRELIQAAAADPKNADKLVALAQFIYDQSWQIHGDSGDGYKPISASFRYANPKAEQQEAIRICDQALQVDRMNVQARSVKAGALIELHQDDAARNIIDEAMNIKADDPKTLRLYSELLIFASWENTNAGDALSAPTMTEDDQYVYIHSRSDRDLSQARAYNGMAENQQQTAQSAMQTAIEKSKGTGAEFYYSAIVAQRAGDKKLAVTNMTQAAALEPDNSYYHFLLGDLAGKLDKPDRVTSFEQLSASDNFYQTSASKLVNLAWHQLRLRDYDGAKQTLEKAMKLDPADPRPPAYMGLLIAGQTGNPNVPDESPGWLVAAWALEQSRLRIAGIRTMPTSFKYDANDLGLELSLAVAASQQLMKINRREQAQSILKITLDDAARVDPAQFNFPAKTASLPIPEIQNPTVPGPRGLENIKVPTIYPLSYWVKNAHLLSALALKSMGKTDEAAKENDLAGEIKDVPRDMNNPLMPGQGNMRR